MRWTGDSIALLLLVCRSLQPFFILFSHLVRVACMPKAAQLTSSSLRTHVAYSLRILNSPDPAQAAELAKQKVNDCIPRFEAAGYMELVVRPSPPPSPSPCLVPYPLAAHPPPVPPCPQYEDFLSTLLLHLSSLALPTCSSSSVLSALQDPEQSNSIVVVLRLITSSFIRANAGDYEHFLVHPETGEMMGVRDFCVGEVEACGREADNVQCVHLTPRPTYSPARDEL